MKNFRTLYLYELKKLSARKLTWVITGLLCAFCVCSVLDAASLKGGITFPYKDDSGNEREIFLRDEDIAARCQKDIPKLNSLVMDDAFFAALRENVPDLDPMNLNVFFYTKDAAWSQVYALVGGVIPDPRVCTAQEFYDAVKDARRKSWERSDLSDAERAYWEKQEAGISIPYLYEYPWRGTNRLIDHFYDFLMLLPLAVAACLCGLFSEDRRFRVSPLVFCSKNSRFPLYLAKTAAGLTASVLLAVFLIGADMGTWLALYGTDGLSAAIQLYDTVSGLPITVGQYILSSLFWLVVFSITCACVTMLISALTHSSIAAFVTPIVLIFGITSYLHLPVNRITEYLPENIVGWIGLQNWHLVNLFGVQMNSLQFAPLLYAVIALVLLLLCGLCWRRDVVCR